MKKLLPGVLVAVVACTQSTRQDSLPTQADVDLKQYAGTWYEQARLPNRFEDHCVGQARADYELTAPNRLQVVNRCEDENGEIDAAIGEGRVASSSHPDPAKLEISFAPAWTSWLPTTWGDYWIISTDYEYSLVGTPDRKYLWVLARKRQASPQRVTELLNRAAQLGFDITAVIRSPERTRK